MKALLIALGVVALGAAASSAARADYGVVMFKDGTCRAWNDTKATPVGDLDDIGEYLNPILPKRVGDLEKEDVCNQQECDMHQAYINRCYTYLRELRFKYEKFKDALLWQSVHSMEKLIQVIEDNSNIKDSDKKVIKEANDIILRIKELDNQYRQRNGEVNEEINHAADLKMAAFLRITQSTIQPQNRSDSDRTSLTSEMREEPLKPPYSINCLPCIKRSVKLEEP